MVASVAIFAFNGLLGKPVYDALTSPQFKSKVGLIKIVTRSEPKERLPGVDYVIGDISKKEDVSQLVSAVGEVDAIVALNAPLPQIYAGLEALLAQVKPKLYIPSQFGVDPWVSQKLLPGFLAIKTDHSEAVRGLGIKVVDVFTGLFHLPGSFSYEIVGHYGIESDGLVIQRGDPKTELTVTATSDVGRVVASLVTASDYSKLPDAIRVESDRVTFEEVQHTWAKNHNKEIKVVKSLTKDEALKEVQDDWNTNGFSPDKFLYYLQSLASQGAAGGTLFTKNDDQLVNPGIWEWVKFQSA